MRVRVKICGVTTPEARDAAAAAGADAVGFVFAESPRRIELDRACALAAGLPPWVASVAVFRLPDPAEVARVVRRLRPHWVQSEPVEGLVESIGPGVGWLPVLHDGPDVVERGAALGAPAVLLEAAGRGGRGVAPDWERAARLARRRRLVLAGGLSADNVGGAVRIVRPWAVDVSSGVEAAAGVKDRGRIEDFLQAVRRAEPARGDAVEESR